MKSLFILLMASVCFLFTLTPISSISKVERGVIKTTQKEEPLSDYHNDVANYWIGIYSEKYNVPQSLMESIFYQESRYHEHDPKYNAHVVGDGGRSFGVGQVQLATAKGVWKDSEMNITKNKLKYNIEFNIETSTRLVAQLRQKYRTHYKTDKEVWLAVLTAYNAGEGYLEKNKKFNRYAFEVYNRYKKI